MKAAKNILNLRLFMMASAALFLCAFAINALAQSFPAKPVRLIIPFPPGGGNDIMGRVVATKLTERFGQNVVAENRAGADGIIGSDFVAKQPPDGYTILIISTSFAQNAAIHKLPFDPLKSFTPISLIGTGPTTIFAAPGFEAKNVQELIALARSKPGGVSYASSGIGGLNHFGGELFNHLAKVKLVHVPYKGGGPAMVDVMGGRVEVGFGTLTQVLPLLKSGKLKVLAVGSPRRTPVLPDVPTIAESGVPGYEFSVYWGIMGPAGMPAPIVGRLNGEINNVLKDPEMLKRLDAEAASPLPGSAADFAKLLASDLQKWAQVAKETGIKAE
jgi:tripartite-type tricarboxylate transporter receptor subunit TctC